jgi:hypothetical protein
VPGSESTRPPRLTLALVAVAVAASVGLLSASTPALIVGALAAVVATVGLAGRGDWPLGVSDWAFDGGVAGLFGAVLFAGGRGVAVERVLPAAVLLAVAWTVGRHGRALARQVGPDAPTRRVELVHATATVLVLAVAGAVGTVVARALAGGGSALALALLLFALVAVVAALGDGP